MKNEALTSWVDEVARLTQPDRVVWCDGSEEENDRLIQAMLADGTIAATPPTSRAPST
jgi:phosphoenolpyruvate carboxykinase (GTP)